MSRLILVSNRLPVRLEESSDGLQVIPTTGGLATGLSGPHRESRGCWIGWPGVQLPDGEHGHEPTLSSELQDALGERGFRGVALTEGEHEAYYNRICNRALWPLFHYFTARVNYDEEDWETYVRVNRRFADAVLAEAGPEDTIFVQDFHLMLVPRMLREAVPDLKIGYFLHIPFPSSEIFRVFPARAALLEGLLGADMIGFHTLDYVRHFRTTSQRVKGAEIHGDEILYQGRSIRLCARPLGIEVDTWRKRVASPEVAESRRELQTALAGRRLILGVERLDYTKGIPERLHAFHDYLKRHPDGVEEVMMVQIAVPSRVDVEEYRELKDEVDRLVGAINGDFGRPGMQPLHYIFRSVAPEELTALYALADVALVTPLRDGLNLVAKEYIAARSDDTGVLVLGEFTGAAWELGEALQVNPFDRNSMVDALEYALAMSPEEQARRMAPMRARVERNPVERWVEDCLGMIRTRPAALAVLPPLLDEARKAELFSKAEGRELQLFLDYDGTLREFTDDPNAATPHPETLQLLTDLCRVPGCEVWIVSGRPARDLEDWMGATGVGMVSEHGAWIRWPGQEDFLTQLPRSSDRWKPVAQEAMAQFVDRVPQSFIETKSVGLAWHYRAARQDMATWQARELYQHLGEVLSGEGVEVLRGDKVIEVRPSGVSKGSSLRKLMSDIGKPMSHGASASKLAFAAGDDRTDETMFAALPDDGWSVLVGNRPSRAQTRLPDPQAFRAFLAEWLKSLSSRTS